MAVPFIDLKRDVAAHRETYLAIAARVIDSGTFSLGPEVEAFEKAFAAHIGVGHAVGVSGGTLALYAALLALEIGPGDEVIVPANTFIATAEAVVMAGATPRFADVDPTTHLIDLAICEALLNAKTKAIIPVHLYGQLVAMAPLLEWAKANNLKVIEDGAQAHAAIQDGKRSGSFGDMACFSFYPTKNLGAIGEGGAVATDDVALAERLRAIRLHGIMKEKYRHDIFGSNLKMEALQAGFLADKLTRLDAMNARRREIAAKYRAGLSGLALEVPADTGESHVYHLFILMSDRRDELAAFLKEKGIGTGIHYPIPIHLQPSFARFGGKEGDCSVAERNAKRILSLPMFPDLSDAEVDEVIAGIRAFYG